MASKAIDMTGKRYGRLVFLERAGSDKNGLAIWLCKCDCGRTKVIQACRAKAGEVKSCGCLQKEVAASLTLKIDNSKELDGKTFGRLTALFRQGGRDRDGCILWLCVCECGEKVVVRSKCLISGHTKSCGCIAIENCTRLGMGPKSKDIMDKIEAYWNRPKTRERQGARTAKKWQDINFRVKVESGWARVDREKWRGKISLAMQGWWDSATRSQRKIRVARAIRGMRSIPRRPKKSPRYKDKGEINYNA